jgi:hypothetical protein
MADATITPPDPDHGTTRRGFFGHVAGVAAAGAILHVGLPDAATAQARIDAATDELFAAMEQLHGPGVQLIRNKNHIVSVVEPYKPRIVEFSGPGYYEVEVTEKKRPIYYVERSASNDSLTMGKSYRLTPRDAKHLGVHFMFENDLKRALIRKI